MLKPLMSKFRPDLFDRSKDIAEKQVPAKLKPIVGTPSVTAGEPIQFDAPPSDYLKTLLTRIFKYPEDKAQT